MNKKYFYIILLVFLYTVGNIKAQDKVQGVVYDSYGNVLVGVKVVLADNHKVYVLTDLTGSFSLPVKEGQSIILNYGDKFEKRVKSTSTPMKVIFSQNENIIDMGLIKKNKLTSTQAVSSLQCNTLEKKTTSLISNALFGELAGLQAKQNVGWEASAGWQLRGQGGPLILVDGFPRGLGFMSMAEVESVSVLKDGAATALYGSRGANGVVLITTKRGIYNSKNIEVSYRHGYDIPINRLKMADANTYANAVNEALKYDGLSPKYDQSALDAFKNGTNTDVYPNTDWVKEGMRDFGESNQINLTFRGGASNLRYFGNIEYKNHFGLINTKYTDFSERYNSQVRNYSLNTRMNLDINMTKTTAIKVGLFSALKEGRGPKDGTDISDFYDIPAAAFPVRTSHGYWGGDLTYKRNPIANIADVGYNQTNNRMLEADMRISQDLSMITRGLKADVAIAYDNSADLNEIGSKTYKYEVNSLDNTGKQVSTTYSDNSALSISKSELSGQMIRSAFEATLGYDRSFGRHSISGSAIYHHDMSEGLATNTAIYRQSGIFLAGYNFDNRYMMDIVANYMGNSYMIKGDRFRLFSALSTAWVLSNERFMKEVKFVDVLKVRASYGRSGSEAGLAYGLNNNYWVGSGSYAFTDAITVNGGLYQNKLAIGHLNIPTADKYNIGLDGCLFGHLNFTLDAYSDKWNNIYVANNKVSEMIGISLQNQGVGQTEYEGLEFGLGWREDMKPFKYYINANISFLNSKIVDNGEGYKPYDYLYNKGNKEGQFYGLQAIGYFNSKEEINNSPIQTFSTVSPGDIKYKDQNNDNIIDAYDVVPLGKSTTIPDMVYGLNLGFEYKGFGLDATFQGINGISKVLNVANVHRPLMNNANISTWYLDDKIRWTETTMENASVPRLSTLTNANNTQNSSQWLEDGSFLKLRNLNISYSFPQKLIKHIKMDKCVLFVRGENLLSIDNIKYFNCESLTLAYPDITSVQMGININF